MPEDPPGSVGASRLRYCDDAGLLEAAAVLREGRAVAYPTETQYGLGVDALNGAAVEGLQIIKQRQSGPFLVVIDEADRLDMLMSERDAATGWLSRILWPGPITLLLPARQGLPPGIVGSGERVGVRVPGHDVPRKLVRLLQSPIVSTSANPSGDEPLGDARAIAEAFGERVGLVLDGGALVPGPPSTLIDTANRPLQVLREGVVSRNGVARRTGLGVEGGRPVPLVLMVCTGNTCRSPMAEGIMRRLLEEKGLSEEFDVGSAGVAAVTWGKAVDESQQVCWSEGIDISAHRPRQLTADLVGEADVLIAMTERHRSRIVVGDPLARDRTYLLAGLAGELKGRASRGYRHIGDPYGGPLRGYTRAYRRIRRELESAFDAILERARDRREQELMKLHESATTEGVLG